MADAARARTADEVVRNAAVGIQLPRLAAESGFTVPSVVPATSVFRDVRVADQILGLARTTRRAVTAGYFTQDAAER
ncbi:hypothetical protein SNOUR_36635 [Streptomyces noursei ATCC 11455]|uniref:hypothetical protein n=1 Tax=Streptomyces noursei TaxID=1971 RepID=UPI00081CAE35|nr:hypothetical protein SNOUR_36635 [Streptomyces noursei ATCC 11455]